jgi:hypothetical protein
VYSEADANLAENYAQYSFFGTSPEGLDWIFFQDLKLVNRMSVVGKGSRWFARG